MIGGGWYRFLSASNKNSLLSNEVEEGEGAGLASSSSTSFVVCGQDEGKNRFFKRFENYLDFFAFMKTKIPLENNRHFYEVVSRSKDYKVKPYFDIDYAVASPEEEADFSEALLFFKEKLETEEMRIGEANIYLSHSPLDPVYPKKLSYHIVIDKVYLDSVRDAKIFCDYCCAKFSSSLLLSSKEEAGRKLSEFIEKGAIDRKVYKTNQQFRLLGSCKAGSGDRVKRSLSSPSSQTGEKNLTRKDFASSLISFTLECRPFDFSEDFRTFYATSLASFQKQKFESLVSFNEDFDLEKCILKLKSIIGEENYVYNVRDVRGDIVILNRNRESFCSVCQRAHSNEHPYLKIMSKTTAVFNCRRSVKGKGISFDFEVEGEAKKSEGEEKDNSNKILSKFLRKKRAVSSYGGEDTTTYSSTADSLQTLIAPSSF